MIKNIVLCCLLFAFVGFSANAAEPVKNNPVKFKTEKKKKKALAKTDAAYCRICCTVTMTNSDGESADATRCAGWLLTSCETAAEKACSKAREAVSDLIM